MALWRERNLFGSKRRSQSLWRNLMNKATYGSHIWPFFRLYSPQWLHLFPNLKKKWLSVTRSDSNNEIIANNYPFKGFQFFFHLEELKNLKIVRRSWNETTIRVKRIFVSCVFRSKYYALIEPSPYIIISIYFNKKHKLISHKSFCFVLYAMSYTYLFFLFVWKLEKIIK